MFKFKQFTIHQDRCGMKVCIDSCIFGASVGIKDGERILDIGTGTGLLSLMLAQKGKVNIDAVEIDLAAYEQALENVEASPFSRQITVHHSDILNFSIYRYDLIIVNPPFYKDNLQSPDEQKANAKHQNTLKLKPLAKVINDKLAYMGRAVVMLPLAEMEQLKTELTEFGLTPRTSLKIKHQESSTPIRDIVTFSRSRRSLQKAEIHIREADNVTYSKEFQSLLRDYYIIF